MQKTVAVTRQPMNLRIILAADYRVLLERLSRLLNDRGAEFLARTTDRDELPDLISRLRPDLVTASATSSIRGHPPLTRSYFRAGSKRFSSWWPTARPASGSTASSAFRPSRRAPSPAHPRQVRRAFLGREHCSVTMGGCGWREPPPAPIGIARLAMGNHQGLEPCIRVTVFPLVLSHM